MARTRLDVTSLEVTSFETQNASLQTSEDDSDGFVPWCCTGCDSGCGIFPTAGGCVSAGPTANPCITVYPCVSVDICVAGP